MDEPKLSIVVPVYNSGVTLAPLAAQVGDVLTPLGFRYELIFVDDSPGDQSWKVLTGIQRAHPATVHLVKLMRNFGQHNALMCGFREAAGEYVVTMDDDLQQRPADIPKLLEKIEREHLDLVYGSYPEKQHAGWRNLGTWLVRQFFRTTFNVTVRGTSFRIMRRDLVTAITSYELNFTYIDGLLAWATTRIGAVEVEHLSRGDDQGSGYDLRKLMRHLLNLIFTFSTAPLRLIFLTGLGLGGIGLAFGILIVVQTLWHGRAVPGFAATFTAICVFGGLQMIALGLVGEYIGRILLSVNRKPQYVVRTRIGATRT